MTRGGMTRRLHIDYTVHSTLPAGLFTSMSTPLQSSEPVDGDRKVTPVTFYVSALAVAVIDAATKYAAWALQPEPGASAVGGLLQFHLHQNSGFMLGIGSSLGDDYRVLVLSTITSVVLLSLLAWLVYRGFTRTGLAIAWGAVVGSAGANLVERIRDGAVTDFLQLNLLWIQTGIFNLADLFNLAGLCYVAVSILFRDRAL